MKLSLLLVALSFLFEPKSMADDSSDLSRIKDTARNNAIQKHGADPFTCSDEYDRKNHSFFWEGFDQSGDRHIVKIQFGPEPQAVNLDIKYVRPNPDNYIISLDRHKLNIQEIGLDPV